jgi:hypothetical protein
MRISLKKSQGSWNSWYIKKTRGRELWAATHIHVWTDVSSVLLRIIDMQSIDRWSSSRCRQTLDLVMQPVDQTLPQASYKCHFSTICWCTPANEALCYLLQWMAADRIWSSTTEYWLTFLLLLLTSGTEWLSSVSSKWRKATAVELVNITLLSSSNKSTEFEACRMHGRKHKCL